MLNWWLPGCTLLYFTLIVSLLSCLCSVNIVKVDTVIVKVDASIVTEDT